MFSFSADMYDDPEMVTNCKRFCKAIPRGDITSLSTMAANPMVNLIYVDEHWWSPLSYACSAGRLDVVKLLFGYEIVRTCANYKDSQGSTPFSLACWNKHEDLVAYLVTCDWVDINAPMSTSRSPLWMAAFRGSLEIIEILIASGRALAILGMDFHQYLTPAEIAKKEGHHEIHDLLKAYEEDSPEVRERIRKKRGYYDEEVGELFSLVVYHSDGYLKPKVKAEGPQDAITRFFNLSSKLPLEIQMLLCKRAYGLGGSVIRQVHSERGFVKFAR